MINQEIEKKIRHLEIHTKRLLRGSSIGDFTNAQKGYGLEFEQLADYQFGDDIRFIDWKSSARMNKILIKEYREERNRTIILMVDVSTSTYFGSEALLKAEIIAQVAGILALVGNYGKDRVGLITFSDKVERFMPPSRGHMHSRAIMQHLFSIEHKKITKTTIATALEFLGNLKLRDCIVFLISDFIDYNFEKSLAHSAKKHEMIAIRCLDRSEHVMPSVGFIHCIDGETGTNAVVDTRTAHQATLSLFYSSRLAQQNQLFKKYGVDILDISSQRPYLNDIISFFGKRIRN